MNFSDWFIHKSRKIPRAQTSTTPSFKGVKQFSQSISLCKVAKIKKGILDHPYNFIDFPTVMSDIWKISF